eukprot:XP_017952825.1 PREDICTED: uncharacterized protein LOC101732265 [Xenopus tropicalis]
MPRGRRVGIFSREPSESYKWLTDFLLGLSFIKGLLCSKISNSNDWSFREDVNQCKFAILYHSRNRGRLNVTDVTDSLYDKELNYLSSTLGKANVIVIIDDVEDSSDKEKERIQQGQTTITDKATGLFLFSKEDKCTNSNMKEKKLQEIESLIRRSFQLMGLSSHFQTGTMIHKMGRWQNALMFFGLPALVVLYIYGFLYYNFRVITW